MARVRLVFASYTIFLVNGKNSLLKQVMYHIAARCYFWQDSLHSNNPIEKHYLLELETIPVYMGLLRGYLCIGKLGRVH